MEKGRFLLSHTDHINQSEFEVAHVDPERYYTFFAGFIDSSVDKFMASAAIEFLRRQGTDAYLVGNTDDFERGIYEHFEGGEQ
jgi:hypothetical protein